LPPEITRRTRELARRITAGAVTEYDKALAIKAWLAANLSYTLVLADPGLQEPVDFFLFDRKKGHCEYFASAFAVLARAVGIPTRQVNGFLGGEWNEYQSYVAVRAGDAHSWDEVYVPGAGWVTLDPTPPGNVDALGRGGAGWAARLGRLLDTARFHWNKWVIEYDLTSQLSLFRQVGGVVQSAARLVKRGAIGAKDAALANGQIALGLAAAIAGVVVIRRRRRRVSLGGPRHRPRPRPRSPIAAIYDDVARLLTRAGVPREAAVTPRELADRYNRVIVQDLHGPKVLVHLSQANARGSASVQPLLGSTLPHCFISLCRGQAAAPASCVQVRSDELCKNHIKAHVSYVSRD